MRQNMTQLIDELAQKAKDYLAARYVERADDRQKAMGLSYITAETTDLAQFVADFAELHAEKAIKKHCACKVSL
jgi:hypothetical protein